MADLGITSLSDIEQLTFNEFVLRLKAHRLKELNKERDMYKLAWAFRAAKATKRVGGKKSGREEWQFKQITDVLDYEANRKNILNGGNMTDNKPEIEAPQKDELDMELLAELSARINSNAKDNENKEE